MKAPSIIGLFALCAFLTNCASLISKKCLIPVNDLFWTKTKPKSRFLRSDHLYRSCLDDYAKYKRYDYLVKADTIIGSNFNFAFCQLDGLTEYVFLPRTIMFGPVLPIIPNIFYPFGPTYKKIIRRDSTYATDSVRIEFYLYDVTNRKEIDYDSLQCYINDSIPMYHMVGRHGDWSKGVFYINRRYGEMPPWELKKLRIEFRSREYNGVEPLKFTYKRKLAYSIWRGH